MSIGKYTKEEKKIVRKIAYINNRILIFDKNRNPNYWNLRQEWQRIFLVLKQKLPQKVYYKEWWL